MPKVSVIVPNYNHSKYLAERISSILKQSYTDYELIILDDCSSDNSRDIIEIYRDHPAVSHVVLNAENSASPFKQWNTGIRLAKGELVWIAESDDHASPHFLERLVGYLESDADISLVYTQSNEIDESNRVIGNMISWTNIFSPNIWNSDFVMEGDNFIQAYLGHRNVIPNASAVLFRKDIFVERYDNRISEMRMTGDWLLWISLLSNKKVGFLCDSLNNFRSHSKSTRIHHSHERKLIRILEEVPVIRKASDVARDNMLGPQLRERNLESWCRQFPSPLCLFQDRFYIICDHHEIPSVVLIRSFMLFQLKRLYSLFGKR